MKKKMGSSKPLKKYQMRGEVKSTPSYKNLNMGVKNEYYEMTGQNKDITPSSSDSANYRRGYERGLKGGKAFPGERNVEKMGRWEGQNVKKSKTGGTVKKMKMGGSCGTSKSLSKKKK